MSGTALTGANAHELTGRKRQWRPTLRDDIRVAWSAIDERRGIRRDQLDGTEEVANWLFRAARQDGTPGNPAHQVDRSIPEIVRGLGWEKMPTKQKTRDRYRNQITRRLEYMQRIGWVESVEPVYDEVTGEGRCILIRLTPAGVAQSVAAALPQLRDRGASRTTGRALCALPLSGQVSLPLRESGPCGDLKSAGSSTSVTRRAPVARARRRKSSVDANGRSRRAPAPRAAVQVPLAQGGAVSAPAAQGTEREGRHRSDLKRMAVADQLKLWGIGGAVTVGAAASLLSVALLALLAGWLA